MKKAGGNMNTRDELKKLRDKAKQLYKQGKNPKEISAELNINYNTVRQWKARYWGNISVSSKCNKSKVIKMIPDRPIEPEELTNKEKLFCEIYIRNFNATQAAIKAGYSKHSATMIGYKLLQKKVIKAYVDELKAWKKETLMFSVDDLVDIRIRIANADITDFVTFGKAEVPMVYRGEVISFTDLATGEIKTLMREISTLEFLDSKQVDGNLISQISTGPQGMKLKLEDRQKAMEWLDKYFLANPLDRRKIDYENKKLELEQQRFEHQKSMDERNNF
jgi:phage terminase small subunit